MTSSYRAVVTAGFLALAVFPFAGQAVAGPSIWGGFQLGMTQGEARMLHPDLESRPFETGPRQLERYHMPGPFIGSCRSRVAADFLSGVLVSVDVEALTDFGDAHVCAEEWGRTIRRKYGVPLFDVRSPMEEVKTWNAREFSIVTDMTVLNTVVLYTVSYQPLRRKASEML
ncbi:hypothetical protein [Gluconobacter morbifer]|nr:hypothetical protein [Gluconobacter morbifer]